MEWKSTKQIEADGYVFDENDYVTKVEIVEETPIEETAE